MKVATAVHKTVLPRLAGEEQLQKINAALKSVGSSSSSTSQQQPQQHNKKRTLEPEDENPQQSQQQKLKGGPHEVVSAYQYVKNNLHLYFPHDSPADILELTEQVTLQYPNGEQEVFPMVVPLRDGYTPIMDLVKCVELVAEDFPRELGDKQIADIDGKSLYRRIERAARRRDVAGVRDAVGDYNQTLDGMRRAGQFARLLDKPLSYNQSIIMLDQVYARGVTDPDSLRQYKGFSKEVYGETGHGIIRDLLERELPPFTAETVFLDLGSGIGNVVLQVASMTKCKAYGVELLERPSIFGKNQLVEYRARMRMYARSEGAVYLRRGDFLGDQKVLKVLECAHVVFVNNYAFEEPLNQGLKNLFLHLQEGTHVVSFKPFRPLVYNITAKNVNDISSILTVRRVPYGNGSVSWTHSGGEYYVHRVDRSQLKQYMQSQREGTARTSGRR